MTDNLVFLGRVGTATLAAFQDWERLAHVDLAARRQLVPVAAAFETRPTDVLDWHPHFAVADGTVFNARTGRSVVGGGDGDVAGSIASAAARRCTYAELLAGIPEARQDAAARMCRRLIGSALGVTAAVDRLQRSLPHSHLVRFPQQSPYTLPRAYWENSIAVRDALPLLYESASSSGAFAEAFCGLHRLATLGESGTNFYGGASSLPTVPGVFREGPASTWLTPPVRATLARWLESLGVDASLPSSAAQPRIDGARVRLLDDGLTCVHLGGSGSVRDGMDGVRTEVSRALRARERRSDRDLIAACARLHQLIAALHPFANVNNSVAMNIVNDLLTTGGPGAVPHLLLDYLALRLSPAGYATVFATVVAACASGAGRSERLSLERSADLLRLATLAHRVTSRSA